MDQLELGRLIEKVDTLTEEVHSLKGEVTNLKSAMNKGWGIVVGGVAVIGLFANELIDGLKRLIGIGGP